MFTKALKILHISKFYLKGLDIAPFLCYNRRN
nr:MAG TPA: hypothetical protein [Caudoviricetes sp.]